MSYFLFMAIVAGKPVLLASASASASASHFDEKRPVNNSAEQTSRHQYLARQELALKIITNGMQGVLL